MTDLPTPRTYLAPIPAEDIRAFLKGVPPGGYRARDLLPRYLAWTQVRGGPPRSAKDLGEGLGRAGVMRMSNAGGNVTVWFVTPEWSR